MLDRHLLAERHLRDAGMQPRARRETCARAPWGDVRPAIGGSFGGVGLGNGSEMEQRGRTGTRSALA